MRARSRDSLVLITCILSVLAGVYGLVLTVADPSYLAGVNRAPTEIQVVGYLPAVLALPIVGAVVAMRRPRHPVGWLLLASGLALDVGLLLKPLLISLGQPGDLADAVGRAPFIAGLTLPLLAWLFFPTGRLLSPRWRVAACLVIVCVLLNMLAIVLGLAGYDSSTVEQGRAVALFGVLWILSVVFVALSFSVRFRRARLLERQQLKWLLYPAILMAGAFLLVVAVALLAILTGPGDPSLVIIDTVRDTSTVLFVFLFGMLPVGAGIAILRYRLLDIDLLINRTLVYGTLSALVVGLYAALNSLAVRFVSDRLRASSSDIGVIVLVTLVSAALFTPVKNALQRSVDKLVPPEKDPAQVLGAFREQVQTMGHFVNAEQLNPDGVLRELVYRAAEAFGALGGAVLLGDPGRQMVAQTAGTWEGQASLTIPLESGGEEFGVLALGPRKGHRQYETEDQEVLRRATEVVALLVGPRITNRAGKPHSARRPRAKSA